MPSASQSIISLSFPSPHNGYQGLHLLLSCIFVRVKQFVAYIIVILGQTFLNQGAVLLKPFVHYKKGEAGSAITPTVPSDPGPQGANSLFPPHRVLTKEIPPALAI